MSVTSILPFLMFQNGKASAALDFYARIFPDARIDKIERYGPGEASPEGTIRLARFTIGGQSVKCIDSPVPHAFDFTPAFSFFVECETEDEVRHFSDTLKEGGAELMPIANYGFSRLFAWVSDRFGVSWQINCQ